MDPKKYNSIDVTGCVADPQILLSKALADRNIEDFRAAIALGAKPLASDDRHLSVFEVALQTPGCVEFVEECFKAGCDPNYLNTHYIKILINFATDSRDPQIVGAILSKPGVKVNFAYARLTPLNSLAKNLTQENANDVFKCAQMLLDYGASPNIPDQREMTPLQYIVTNQKIDDVTKLKFLELFLNQSSIDVDSYRRGELRQILTDKYPNLKLPGKQKNIYQMLINDLRDKDMMKFKQHFEENLRNITDKEKWDLLIASIEKGAHEAFDLLMATCDNYNKSLDHNNTSIEIAWIQGNWYALKKLLEKPDIQIKQEDTPLSCIVRKLNEETYEDFCDYWKCFYVLLESDKIDINKCDRSRSTALHSAVKYRNNKAVKELLKRGADITIKSCFNDLPIDGMSPEVLEDHFNDCITTNGIKLGDEALELTIDLKNLIAENKSTKQSKEVMAPIAFMAKSKEYRHLMQHPVITSFLYLKWQKLSWAFYINFALYFVYAVSIIAHAVLKFRQSEYETALYVTQMFSWWGILYLIVREIAQFIMSPLRYLSSATNYMEIILILLSIITCSNLIECDLETQRILAVFTILLVAVELCLLVGSLPISSVSTHMLMLEEVCKSFLKSFTLYSIFIITFTLCFYILHDSQKEDNAPKDGSSKKGNDKDEKEEDVKFNEFPDLLVGFSKTIVMLTGEFDASDLKLVTAYRQIIFLIFVFFVTIILFNLLNGLAVSDTQAIQDQAELNFHICRTQLLARYEQLVSDRSKHAKSLANLQPIRKIFRYFKNLCPDSGIESKITIKPNKNNEIIYKPNEGTRSINKMSYEKMNANNAYNETVVPLTEEDLEMENRTKTVPCCFSFFAGKCSKMEGRIVKLAMAVVVQKDEKKIENRLESMEEKLEQILKYISRHET